MKRYMSLFLILVLVITLSTTGFTLNIAEASVDVVTTATTYVEETPVKPETPTSTKPSTPEKTTEKLDDAPLVFTTGNTHIVVANDVMWKIAAKHKLTLAQLIELNPQIKNPNRIFIGQKIIISTETASTEVIESKVEKTSHTYPNGTYRGDFYDSGALQVVVQFTLQDNVVRKPSYRTLYYGDIDYRAEKTDSKIIAIHSQFNELLQYMEGKKVETAVEALYKPGEIVKDQLIGVDTISGASVRSSKVISAINNGLARGPYSIAAPSLSYENGTYRGTFSDSGAQQVGVQFSLVDNIVTNATYRLLTYRSIDYRAEKEDLKVVAINTQFIELMDYLKNKDIRLSLNDLYASGNIVDDITVGVDTISGATVRSSKVISAINDGLQRGVFSYSAEVTPSPNIASKNFENGTYRGSYIDSNEQQVGIQLTLEDNIVTKIAYRTLAYKGINYRSKSDDKKIIAFNEQYNELIEFLLNKDIRAEFVNLYWPGKIVANKTVDIDTLSGATIRANKVTSAIVDSLNRGPYSK